MAVCLVHGFSIIMIIPFATLATLVGTLQQSNVQMAIFFNGALEPERFGEWRARQLHLRNNVRQVLKHVHKRATPPPKAW